MLDSLNFGLDPAVICKSQHQENSDMHRTGWLVFLLRTSELVRYKQENFNSCPFLLAH